MLLSKKETGAIPEVRRMRSMPDRRRCFRGTSGFCSPFFGAPWIATGHAGRRFPAREAKAAVWARRPGRRRGRRAGKTGQCRQTQARMNKCRQTAASPGSLLIQIQVTVQSLPDGTASGRPRGRRLRGKRPTVTCKSKGSVAFPSGDGRSARHLRCCERPENSPVDCNRRCARCLNASLDTFGVSALQRERAGRPRDGGWRAAPDG